jgi:hypothetical protein
MDVVANNWRCDSCEHRFQYDGDPVAARCPSCGSEWLTRFIDVHDEIRLKISEHVVLKGKDPALTSKRKLRREVRSGVRPEGSGSGRLVEERRISDADSNEYEEKIVDVDSEVVLRDIAEPLSKHRGGSEKGPKK